MARTVVTQDLIIKMNELYLKIGTYSGVSRELGGSPSPTTVKKYIIPNYNPIEKITPLPQVSLPEINYAPFSADNWNSLLMITDDEKPLIEKVREIVVL